MRKTEGKDYSSVLDQQSTWMRPLDYSEELH